MRAEYRPWLLRRTGMRALLSVLLLTTMFAVQGCTGAAAGAGGAATAAGASHGIPFVAVVVAGAVIISEVENKEKAAAARATDDNNDEDVELRDTKDLLNSPASAPLKAGDVPPGVPVGALRAAVASVDLSICRESQAPRGYGHARVTLEPNGSVSKIVIDGPPHLPKSAVICVGSALATIRVDAFNGKAATVGTTWFVP